MPKVSINILTKNRAGLLKKALASVFSQTFSDFEVLVVNNGSSDNTEDVLKEYPSLKVISHSTSVGITRGRQEALLASTGEYVAVLDDDDEWTDKDKLSKQVDFLDANKDYVLVGGGILTNTAITKLRSKTDDEIRKTMLFRNNFFTSTVMFKRGAAINVGSFVQDADDFAEDYDLWLRLGRIGKMYNFQQAFAQYRLPNYNKEKKKAFLNKQLRLIYREKDNYQEYWLASLILRLRTIL